MNPRWLSFLMIAGLAITAGCNKIQPAPTPPPPQTIARIHWLGKTQIASDTNSAVLMGIWNLPESRKLEAQTLDKLSLAPWSLLHRATGTHTSRLLRPLLEDILRRESCLEIRQATNEPGQLVFAIRLDDARAALWQTNLAIVLESITGIRPVPAAGDTGGWSLHKHHAPDRIELTRLNGWTLIGAAQDHNSLLDDLSARLRAEHTPFAIQSANFWLTADLDLARIASAFSFHWSLTPGFPQISLTERGEGTDVLTHVDLRFAQALPFESESWNIPTNLMHGPLTSLASVRGFKPWLGSLKLWTDLKIGPPPNQFYVWSEQGPLMLTYCAAPWLDASNQVQQLTDFVLQKSSSWATNDDFGFRRARDLNGLEWGGLPFLWPYVRSRVIGKQEFAAAGLFPTSDQGDWPAPNLPWEILNQTNLVCYAWELTGPRVTAWLYVSQFFRHVTRSPQLPFNSASLQWLNAIPPKLGKCVTRVSLTDRDQLSIERQSTLGFAGVELHLLADWLESPEFPKGLHTSLAPPETP